nr:(Na+)-NQR maturation NqrM [Reinekea sp.]
MSTILVAFVFMSTVVALMAVGVIFGRKPIAGSCGGMAALGMLSECDVCGGDQAICDEENQVPSDKASAALSYDASK